MTVNDESTAAMHRYRCFGCGFEVGSLDDLTVIPGADGRDGRHHCDQCYVEWLAEVTR